MDRGLKRKSKRGLKVQSPIGGTGVTWPIYGPDMGLIWYKSKWVKYKRG